MTTILFPGTFDPFTIGHASLVSRALPLCDRMVIAIGYNSAKHSAENIAGRVAAIEAIYAGEPKVKVISYDGLTVDACRREGAGWMLRGVRSVADYEYERNLADINRSISGIETILLYSLPELSHISSSMVRELASHGHDVSKYLPDTL
ncbi:MAG: pantetheine-phosphate adenylyltransferase [Duncaniella sp.]|nr:pantetheine-phosphate adenylyltransferase [Duncaniella sp.]MDE6066303.1 pantetheine-phosphate adenylyltransferase [Duncaniella sp.]